MIKNDRQLKRSEKKLSELKSLLSDVQSRYSGKSLLLYPQLANTGRVLGIDFTICPKPRKEEKPTSSYQ